MKHTHNNDNIGITAKTTRQPNIIPSEGVSSDDLLKKIFREINILENYDCVISMYVKLAIDDQNTFRSNI